MRLAVMQFDPELGRPARNLESVAKAAAQAANARADLVILPECALSGYMFESLATALDVAEPVPGASTRALEDIARREQIYLIAGMLERNDSILYNSAVVVSPAGLLSTYRKTHTLCLGVDRFTRPGTVPYTVLDLPIGRVGVLICYDLRFPEAARTLALAGAQLIAVPTNWPDSSGIMPEVFARCRAAENRVYLAAADRVGEEGGATFLGRSIVVAPDGTVLREAGKHEPEMLVEDLDLSVADRKHVIFTPGEHEMDLDLDRRPDLYDVTRARDMVTSQM